MGLGEFLVARRIPWLVIASAFVTFASPSAAATPKLICQPGSVPGVSASGLGQATRAAEEAIDRRLAGGGGSAEIALLDVADEPTASIPPLVRARYCAAAGELMRVDPGGNQLEARQFLLAAVNLAREAGDTNVEARAAYRLGLTLLGGDSVVGANTRGAGQPKPATVDNAPAPPSEDGPCATIEAPVVRGPSSILARAALGCAAVRALEAGDADRAALARLRLARLMLADIARAPFRAAALRTEAADAARQGLQAARQIASPLRRALLTGRLAEVMATANPADEEIAKAIALMRADASGDAATLAFAAALEGRIKLAQGDRRAAEVALERAVFLEGQRSQPLRLPNWLLLLAEARPDRRAALVQQAYRALEAIRPILPLNDALTEESNFALQMRPVFEAAVAAQLAEAGSDQARIASVQRILETYREAELQSAFGANCVPSRDPVDPATLRIGEVLLYPILVDDRVELLFVAGGGGGGGAARYSRLATPTPITRRAVAQLVDDMTSSIVNGGDDRWKEAAHTLYDLLIKPIEGRLQPGGTLVIVPDGPLRALPFAALIDGNDKFLIERTQLALAPALAYSQPGRDRGAQSLKVVAVALQREVDLPAGRFAKLAGTRDEALAAAGPGGTVIDDFREADLRRALGRGRVDVLHLATHAAFNGRSDRSFIVANGEAIPLADLRGLIGESRTRGDDLDLLVLSACETAVGDDLASMGLAGAAVQSGAESAIASLWSVNDTGTVALMKQFYDRYRGGDSKAAALRQAQLALIARSDELAHPSIWAAFTLLGGWR